MTFIRPFDEAIKEMRHLDLENLQGRRIPLIPLHDFEGWHVWLSTPEGQIMHLRPIEAAEAMYFAEKAANESEDFHWLFVDFLVQRFELGKVTNRLSAIIDDVWCLSASMAKIELSHQHVHDDRVALDWLVATEIEYLVSVCRSMFDLLQEVIVHVWESITLDGNDRRNAKLKQKFSDIVLRDDAVLSSDEISHRSKIPDFLADYYAACGPFFLDLRNYRNKFLHRGDRAERIYVSQWGFSVRKDAQPFAKWNVWDEESMETNVASLRPVLRYIVGNTLSAFARFAELMVQRVRFPPPLAPGYTVFFRNAYNAALLRALSPDAKWWDRREQTQPVPPVVLAAETPPSTPSGRASPADAPPDAPIK